MTEKKMAREKSEINEQDVCKADEYGELNVVNIRLVKEPSIISDEPVRCSDDASRLIRELLSGFDREVFAILNLASDGKPINMNVVSIGTLNASLVSPREVFKSSILSNAACFIAYHCHPSGNPKPSLEDFEATQRLREAGAILDIKIIMVPRNWTTNCHKYSEHGIIKNERKEQIPCHAEVITQLNSRPKSFLKYLRKRRSLAS